MQRFIISVRRNASYVSILAVQQIRLCEFVLSKSSYLSVYALSYLCHVADTAGGQVTMCTQSEFVLSKSSYLSVYALSYLCHVADTAGGRSPCVRRPLGPVQLPDPVHRLLRGPW